MKNENALLIFAKEPVAGKVKTRMHPDLSLEEAAKLYDCMLNDLYNKLHDLKNTDVIIYFAPIGSREYFQKLNYSNKLLMPQSKGDLGEKLANSFAETFRKGYKRILVIGSDCLTLTKNEIYDYFDSLLINDALIGPTADGGYYILGLNNFHRQAFENVNWSTESVFKDTIKKFKELNLKYFVSKSNYDIDTIYDLKKFINEEISDSESSEYKNLEKYCKSINIIS